MAGSLPPVPFPTTGLESHQRSFMETARDRLQTLLARLSGIDPYVYERTGDQPIRELRKLLQQVLGETEQLGTHLMERCDAVSVSPGDTDDRDAVPIANELSRLSDVCFMAVADTRTKQRDLIRSSFDTDSMRVLSACGSSLRRLRKALSSIELQLSRSLGVRSGLTSVTTLEDSLEIRKAYSILRKTAEADGPPGPTQVLGRLRAIDLRITLLSEKTIYLRLRLEDRLQLAGLQERLRSALASAADRWPT
jgi:hypothetical protein